MWEMIRQVLSQMFFMVLHVVNSGSFPKPLTAEEERMYLQPPRNGRRWPPCGRGTGPRGSG